MNISVYITGIIGTFLLFSAGLYFKSNKTFFKRYLFFAIFMYAISICLYWYDEIKSEPKLKVPIFSEEIRDFTFSLGEGGISIIYTKERLEKEHITSGFVFGDYHPVDLYIENNILYADVNIFGGYGLPPIEIKKNRLFNKPDNWDFNSNENALEIVEENQLPIYQFFYKNKSHIVMNGIFPIPGGIIFANKNGTIFNPPNSTSFKLKRIFKYPSWKYPGEIEK